MTTDDLIIGLDIGTSKVCAVIAAYNENDALEILGYGVTPSAGLRQGVVINIEDTLNAVSEAIEAAEHMSGQDAIGVRLFTAMAGGAIDGFNSRGVVGVSGRGREMNKITKGKEISGDDILRVIDAAKAIVIPMDREILHVIPQEYAVDDQPGIRNPLNMVGVRLDVQVHIITGPASVRENIMKCVNRAGFEMNQIVLESMASSAAVLSRDEKELGVLLIDMGAGTTDVLVFRGGAPYYTHVLPLGGEHVTHDISYIFNTPVQTAERIKVENACCWTPLVDPAQKVLIPGVGGHPARDVSRKELSEIAQARVAEILGMVKRTIAQKGYLNKLGGGIVITGGGAQMPGIAELAGELFGGIPARIGRPQQFFPEEMSDLRKPEFATALGLVLYADQQQNDQAGGVSGRKYKQKPGMKKVLGFFKKFV